MGYSIYVQEGYQIALLTHSDRRYRSCCSEARSVAALKNSPYAMNECGVFSGTMMEAALAELRRTCVCGARNGKYRLHGEEERQHQQKLHRRFRKRVCRGSRDHVQNCVRLLGRLRISILKYRRRYSKHSTIKQRTHGRSGLVIQGEA